MYSRPDRAKRERYLNRYEPEHAISNGVVCATGEALDQPARARSLVGAFACCSNNL